MKPELRSHFYPQSGVSLLLPEDWVRLPKSEENDFDVVYQSTLLSQNNPSIAINCYELEDAWPGAHHRLAQESPGRNLPGFIDTKFTEISLQDITVDNRPASIHSYSWYNIYLEVTVMQQFIYVQANATIIRLINTAHQAQWLRYRTVFEQALRSVRLILI
jgi:hypothetical protein